MLGLLTTCAILVTANGAADPDEDRVPEAIARAVEAYGGADLLEAATGYHLEGRVLSIADGVNGALALDVALDGSMRVEIRYPNRTEVRIVAGVLAWNGGRRQQRPSKREMADSIRLQYHRLVAPFELASAAAEELDDAGLSPEGWVRVRREWNDRMSTTYEIDPETGRIERIRGEMGQGDDTLEFVAESSDFRSVEGVLFPFRTTTFVGDRIAAETILDRVDPESEFEPHTFLPSGSAGDM